MDPKGFRLPGSQGSPLFPLSPERVNGIRQATTPSGLPPSPSFPVLSHSKHVRTSSDVQGMVARFNSLDIKDHAELRKKDEAALKRAQMGREEAESELRKVREEARALVKDVEDGKDRERKVAKRLEIVMDELHRAKETQSVAQNMYEKEIRRTKKEAFKSSSVLVRLQEELKSARNTLQVVRSDLEFEKLKVSKREQDTFAAQYQLVGVQEELSKAREQIKVVEEERDALKTSLKEEEVARIAAEGRIALPKEANEDDEFASPRKKTPAIEELDKENAPPERFPGSAHELQDLREDLERQIRRWQAAEEQVEFMKMECQFQCCSCRIAEQQGSIFVHDNSFEEDMQKMKAAIAEIVAISTSSKIQEVPIDTVLKPPNKFQQHEYLPTPVPSRSSPPVYKQHDTSPPFTENIASTPLPKRQPPRDAEPTFVNVPPSPAPPPQAYLPANPATPGVHTVTTTTTIPLAPENDYNVFFSPSGLTREAAIQLLRERRGRARSFAQTPKKTPAGKGEPRRDMSAPEMREGNAKEVTGKTPRSMSRGRGVLR